MRIAQSVVELIGQTPMIRLTKLTDSAMAEVLVKLESFNPSGSIKDRTALGMILAAEAEGRLKAGDTIVEPTSGNTGIGLAMLAAARGYRLILVMPDTMSVERRNLLQAYGAEYVLTPGAKGMQGALDEVERILQENPHYFVPQQFANPANPEIHRTTTAREILEQTEGQLDAFVAGVGTGGTVTGVGEVLKQQLPAVKIIAVEPAASAVLSGKKAGPHKIQGIGAGFVPSVFNKDIVDEVFPVNDQDAMETARQLAAKEGLLVGISSGAAVFAALQLASKLGPGKRVVAIAPDTGERYLTTELFKHD
ncbi:MAG TPA: cysteine synthase A [Firmicutes bacterium]|jgi:cysteine synthase A|nr:cysteine synthase A [Bacillota bacterium]HAA37407.1 cysteine synthase A [Bacillota bacterium]